MPRCNGGWTEHVESGKTLEGESPPRCRWGIDFYPGDSYLSARFAPLPSAARVAALLRQDAEQWIRWLVPESAEGRLVLYAGFATLGMIAVAWIVKKSH